MSRLTHEGHPAFLALSYQVDKVSVFCFHQSRLLFCRLNGGDEHYNRKLPEWSNSPRPNHLLSPEGSCGQRCRQVAWGTEKEPGNDVWPGEKTLDPNGHAEAGVFNNHTGVADFEEQGSLGGLTAFYKGKSNLWSESHKVIHTSYGATFVFNLFSQSPLCGTGVTGYFCAFGIYIHNTRIELSTLTLCLALRSKIILK